MKRIVFIFLLLNQTLECVSQTPYPYGISLDSVYAESNWSTTAQSFHIFKPQSYDSLTSPVLFAIHGTGGNGVSTFSSLDSIAERRKALIIAPNFYGSAGSFSSVIREHEAVAFYVDIASSCFIYRPATELMNKIYKEVLTHEGRSNMDAFMIGFSAGGQFVTRYMLIRQAYPDSIPIKMAVSSNAYYYTFPTDTFMGVAMPWLCGLILSPTATIGDCFHNLDIYGWNCTEHIFQYYNENYGVLIGNADLSPLSDAACAMIQGNNRYERALNFYNFADSNAVSSGTTLRWLYQEVQGVGHDQYLMYNTKASPTDTSTIAETLLFDSPYQTVNYTAPNASFYADTTVIELGDSVHFINTSINSSSYEWNFGDSTLSSNISPWHTYGAIGTYTVMLTAINSASCDNWHENRHYIEVINPSSLNEINLSKLVKLYPNPVYDEITISSLLPDELNITLFDINGKQLDCFKFSSKLDISLRNYRKGVYFYKIYSESEYLESGKFVKL